MNTITAAPSMSQRLPSAVVTSIALHGAALGLLLYTNMLADKHKVTIVNNVDFIQVKKNLPFPKPVAQAQPKSSTFDFLKMALPAVPHMEAPKTMSIKLPEEHRAMTAQAPKLQMDHKRFDAGPKLNMDLDKDHPLDMAKVAGRIPNRRVAALAAMPKLEDVGRRRVSNLPQAIQMEEHRQAAMGLQGADALERAADSHHGVAQDAPLQDAGEAPPASSSFASKVASLLPDDKIQMGHAVMPTTQPAVKEDVPPPPKRKAQLQDNSDKKGVDIEGPLADRKVVAYEIPEFPQWAKDQGVLEANVAIRFWVDKDGNVLPNMRVEHTSGYGQLDRLALDSLSRWKFAPLLTDEKQWGVITFRFVLE